MPLDHLALVAREACVLGSQKIVTIREKVLNRLQTPGHCTDNRLKENPSLFVNKACLLLLELQPKGQASGLAHI